MGGDRPAFPEGERRQFPGEFSGTARERRSGQSALCKGASRLSHDEDADLPGFSGRAVEEYKENAEIYAKQLEGWKDDPWLIGYFLRNEPEFNFVEDLAIADEVLRNPADTCCRRGLVGFLKERYGSISALNQVWGTAFADFSDLEKPVDGCLEHYPGAEKDLREYSVFLIREYSRVPAEACRRVDPNHLNLGLRWSKAYNRDMMAGWEYFDVFSINCYDFDPTKDMDFVKNAGVDLPILMGEFHCGALDRGTDGHGPEGSAGSGAESGDVPALCGKSGAASVRCGRALVPV